MKKTSLFILSLILLVSCSSGGDEGDAQTPPTIPGLVYPTNNLVCIDNTVELKWNASSDAQNDAITYQLDVATDNAFTKNVVTSTTTMLSKSLSLEKGKFYYWWVKAIDSNNKVGKYSSVYTFFTENEGIVNHLPFIPEIKTPVLHSSISGSTTTLSWTAVDADNDNLSYDVYLGTSNPPTQKVASDLSTATYEVSSLTPGTKYYWNIVVKDGKGGTTIGQVWSFSKQ
nr:fibronectin type III domain-containing protein [uncultured Flavobacterium sp.]